MDWSVVDFTNGDPRRGVHISCDWARQKRKMGSLVWNRYLAANLVGDLTNAFVRHDLRTLIGVPIAGAMIFYLAQFESQMTKKSSR